MTLYTFATGVDTSFSTKLNAMYSESLTQSLFSLCRQLEAGTVTFSKGYGDAWGEAYIDVNGRLNSVDTTNSTAWYSTESTKYLPKMTGGQSGDTTHDPDTFTSAANAFDDNDATSATKGSGPHSGGAVSVSVSIGKTFTAKTIGYVRIKALITEGGSWTGTPTKTINLQTYNGSIWSTVASFATTVETAYPVNASVQGVRLNCTITGTAGGANNATTTSTVYTITYGSSGDSTIIQTIPAGTFPAGITKAICAPKVADWETGADIQFKLTNGTDDTGWLTAGVTPSVQSFSAFASAPTQLQVKLIPKSSSPTAGYPSITAAAVRATI